MNWLAHILLSENSIDYQLGNLLADPLKGKVWQGASDKLVAGYRMHSSIDAFTDSNAYVRQSKSRLGENGYLKGVVIDIAYDHCLVKNWGRYSSIDLESFIDRFYKGANLAIKYYPGEAKTFVRRVIESRVLTSYGTLEGLETALHRIDNRLSERVLSRESAAAYLPVLADSMDDIEADFLGFFPQLVAHFRAQADGQLIEHWLR